jgi:ribosomal protein S18 acetylase RimI-like enzyme
MVVIRAAGRADAEAVRAIAAAAYRKYTVRMGREPAPMSADYAQAISEDHVWVALAEGRIAGFMVLVPRPGHLLLENVAVSPADQGLGLGALLLQRAEERARELGLREIRLYTNAAMTENLSYYPSRGYTRTHRAHEDGYDRVFFRKVVAP